MSSVCLSKRSGPHSLREVNRPEVSDSYDSLDSLAGAAGSADEADAPFLRGGDFVVSSAWDASRVPISSFR